jgi:hypothetical protein
MDRRDLILDAIKTRFAAIATTALPPYRTTIKNTFLYHPLPLQEDQLPALNITEGDEDKVAEGVDSPYGVDDFDLQIVVEAAVESSADSHKIARAIIQDVRQAIGVDVTWGGLAQDTMWHRSHVMTAQRVQGQATLVEASGAKMSFTIRYRTSRYQSS